MELIKIENNDLTLVEGAIKEIKKFQKAQLQLELMEQQLKGAFQEAMEKTGISKWTTPDGSFKVTYIGETTSNTFDSKRFKEEHPDLYSEYQKPTVRKAYVKLS